MVRLRNAVLIEDKTEWSDCPLVEVEAGVHSGTPVLRGTRMPVSAIVDNFEYGVSVGEMPLPPRRGRIVRV